MNKEEIKKTLNRIACTMLNEKAPIDNDANVIELGADSLDMIEMVMAIEETFFLDIPDADAEELLTVNKMADYLIKKENNNG